MSEHLQLPNALPSGHQIKHYTILQAFNEDTYTIGYLAKNTESNIDVIIREYLPRDIALRDRTSLQVIPKGPNCKHAYEQGLSQYYYESLELVTLKHPNIHNIQACISLHNTAYVITDYIKGVNLDAYSKDIILTEDVIKDSLESLLGAIKQIHHAGYLHTDINPTSILIEEHTSSPIIINLGSANNIFRVKSSSPGQTLAQGYAPHEQYAIKGKQGKLGVWTDIYAMGAVLYRLITGREPIPSTARLTAVTTHQQMDPLIPASILGVDLYSEEFLKAIDHALMLQPDDRPASIEAWERELGMITSEEVTIEDSVIKNEGIEGFGGLTISGISAPEDALKQTHMDFDELNKPFSVGERLQSNSKRYSIFLTALLGIVGIGAGSTYLYTEYLNKPEENKPLEQILTTDEEETPYSDPLINQIMTNAPVVPPVAPFIEEKPKKAVKPKTQRSKKSKSKKKSKNKSKRSQKKKKSRRKSRKKTSKNRQKRSQLSNTSHLKKS